MSAKKEKPVENFVNKARERRLAERAPAPAPATHRKVNRGLAVWARRPVADPDAIPDAIVLQGVAGRPPGPVRRPSEPKGPEPGSLYARLSAMEKGDYLYFECEPDRMTEFQTRVQKPTKTLSPVMQHMKFQASSYTAISAKTKTDVRWLVRVERIV